MYQTKLKLDDDSKTSSSKWLSDSWKFWVMWRVDTLFCRKRHAYVLMVLNLNVLPNRKPLSGSRTNLWSSPLASDTYVSLHKIHTLFHILWTGLYIPIISLRSDKILGMCDTKISFRGLFKNVKKEISAYRKLGQNFSWWK